MHKTFFRRKENKENKKDSDCCITWIQLSKKGLLSWPRIVYLSCVTSFAQQA